MSFATNGMLLGKKVIESCVNNSIEEVIPINQKNFLLKE